MSPYIALGTELFTLKPSLLTKLECCQCFSKIFSMFLNSHHGYFSFDCQVLNSVESEMSIKKLLFLGRLLTG